MQTFYTSAQVAELAKQSNAADIIDFALSLLPQAAECAVVPVSQFKVGAIAIDVDGNFYLGANQECADAAMAQTVHAEQSAISHAWARGVTQIAHIVVNYTPCGHCRQFLNELRGAENLLIHLPHSRDNRLHDYLPDSFSPKDLDIPERLLDKQNHGLTLSADAAATPLVQAALDAANRSYAPYSRAYAGVALQCSNGEIFAGGYAENAAYNPTLPPLQNALNFLRLSGYIEDDVVQAALVCTEQGGHVAHTHALWSALSDVPLQIVQVETFAKPQI